MDFSPFHILSINKSGELLASCFFAWGKEFAMGMATKKSSSKARARAAASLVLLLPLLSTCDLFKVGLGNKVDTEPPTLAISSPANGAYVTGATSLTGTVSDDSGVKSVSAYITFSSSDLAAVTKAATISEGKWSIDLDSAALAPNAETNATIVVTATDTASKTTTQRIILYFDNKAPVIKLTSPTKANLDASDYYLNGSARFKGSADTDVKSVVLDAGGIEFLPNNDNLASFSIQVDTPLFAKGAGGVTADAANAGILSVPYTLYAIDNAGNKSVEYTGSFKVWQDSDSPSLAFVSSIATDKKYSARQSLDLGSFSTNKFEPGSEIKGTISDDDGIDLNSVKAVLSTSSATSGVFQPSDGSLKVVAKETNSEGYVTSASWSFTIPKALALGIYSLGISASDLAEAKLSALASSVSKGAGMSPAVSISSTPSASSGSLSDLLFIVKTGSPTAGLEKMESSDGKIIVSASSSGEYFPKGGVTLRGTAKDAFGLSAVEYSESKSGPWTAGSTFDGAPTEKGWYFNLPAPTEGSHTIYVRAVNTLGEGSATLDSATFAVDTKGPDILVSRPQPGASVDTSTYDISGKCTDAGAGVGSVEYSLDNANWNAAKDTGDWSATGISIGTAEGSRIIYFRAKDKLGNESTSSVNFYYDLNYPSLSETVVNTTALSYVRNNAGTYNLAFGGNASDTNALSSSASLAASLNGGTQTAISVGANGAWSYGLNANSLADGDYILSFTATDVANKATTLARNVRVDRTPPVVHVTPIGGYQSGVIGISGDYVENNIEGVEYQLGSDTGAWSKASVASATAWNGSLDVASAPEGAITLYVRAFDKAGNYSAEATTTVFVDKANPQATEILHGESLIKTRDSVKFSGIADDAAITPGRKASSAVLSYSLNNGAAVTVTTTSPNPLVWNKDSGAWSWTLPSNLGDGFYTITLTVTDSANKTASVSRSVQLDTTVPTLGVSKPTEGDWTDSQSYPINGSALDTGVGLPASGAVEYSVDGGATWKAASGATNWSATADLGSGEGRKDLVIRATDLLGNQATSGTIHVFYDKYYPVLSESGIGGSANAASSYSLSTRSTLTFSGSASDTDALAATKALVVTIDGTETEIAVGSGGAWSYTYNVDSSSHAQDGTHAIVFTARDIANKTTSLARTVTVDTRTPTSDIATPSNLGSGESAYWLSGSTASIGGGAGDSGTGATGVASVYYTTVAKGAAMPAFSASTWKLAAGTTNWNSTIKLSGTDGIGEGEFSLYAVAVDAIGNIQEAAAARNFGVDQNPPAVTESHPATSSASSTFLLSGTIEDTNSLAKLEITESRNSGTARNVPLDTAVGGKSIAWTSKSLPLDGAEDGSYAYTITVTDVAGKTSTITRTVKIDKTPPTVSLTAIPAWISASAYTVGGSAQDPGSGASGLASVSYSLDGGTSIASAWSDTSGGANTAGDWKTTLVGLSEGKHALVISGVDAAGNPSSATRADFGVDLNSPSLTVNTTGALVGAASAASFAGFSGTVGDSNAMATSSSLSVSYTKNGGSATTVSIGYTYAAHSTSNAWSWTPFASGINSSSHADDGIYVFSFTATDIAGKTTTYPALSLTVDTTAPTIEPSSPVNGDMITTNSCVISGTARDTGGVGFAGRATASGSVPADAQYSLDYTDDANDSNDTWIDLGSLSGTVSWTSRNAVDFGPSEGTKKLYIRAADALGNSSVCAVSFYYDRSGPTLDETVVGTADTQYASLLKALVFGGTASDTNALSSLTVSVNGGAPAAIGVNPVTHGWSYGFDATKPEGIYTLTFVATDVVSRTTTVTRTVKLDKTVPSVALASFNGYASGDKVNGSVSFSSFSDDASGIAGTNYFVTTSSSAPAYDSAAGTTPGVVL
jgi:hypothetical protein